MPRVGILVECGPDGLEVHVCRRICELLQLRTGIEIHLTIVSMTNKLALLEGCELATRNLFDRGCDRVVILWDERPAWPDKNEHLCWHHERTQVLQELERANVSHRPVSLVCIEREFESWLLHDHRLLSAMLSTETHRVRIPRQKNPDRMPNPKGRMMSLFKQYGKTYVDVRYARKFAEALDDLNHLLSCPTFRRFAEKVIGRGL
jgi:Domain of unknown function (DUF4276)